jgi:putative N6-adenine-specific DNA methylase
MQFILTCPHGTAQVAKKELDILGYKATIVSSTSLSFDGDERTIARVNLNSRIGNKLFLVVGSWAAKDFEGLYTLVHSVERSRYVAAGQPCLVDALSKNHILTSIPSIQGMTKKAMTNKLVGSDERWEEDPTKPAVECMVYLENGQGTVMLNTSWSSLHMRGYRETTGEAPLKENLAAAMVLMSWWKFNTPLYDPFCGSGTILIEAALIAKNIAPGMRRTFAFEGRSWYATTHLEEERTLAISREMREKKHTIIGFDNDASMISTAQNNARNAGISEHIERHRREWDDSYMDITTYIDGWNKAAVVTNPPYGERLALEDSKALYQPLIILFEDNASLNGCFITNTLLVDSLIHEQMRKQSSLYNGPLECTLYKIARL